MQRSDLFGAARSLCVADVHEYVVLLLCCEMWHAWWREGMECERAGAEGAAVQPEKETRFTGDALAREQRAQ
jgi:hypothetical protein